MCDCIEQVNNLLVEHNAELVLPLFGERRPFIQTEKVNGKKRGRPPLMQASFCPFCGNQYDDRAGEDK